MSGLLAELRTKHLYTAAFAELLGTLLLVVIGCGSCMDSAQIDYVRISLCFGFTVTCLAGSLGTVSGGHINPAVTLGFLVTRRITIVRAALYWVGQYAGAILGAAILRGLVPEGMETILCTPEKAFGFTGLHALACEAIVTFILVFVIFAVTDSGRTDVGGMAALAIGLAITICHLFAITITGSSMNPARAFGPALISNTWDACLVYLFGPLMGALLAAPLYDLIFAVNATPAKAKGFFSKTYDNDDYDQKGKK